MMSDTNNQMNFYRHSRTKKRKFHGNQFTMKNKIPRLDLPQPPSDNDNNNTDRATTSRCQVGYDFLAI